MWRCSYICVCSSQLLRQGVLEQTIPNDPRHSVAPLQAIQSCFMNLRYIGFLSYYLCIYSIVLRNNYIKYSPPPFCQEKAEKRKSSKDHEVEGGSGNESSDGSEPAPPGEGDGVNLESEDKSEEPESKTGIRVIFRY